ncbi:MAG: 2-oxoacid:acceptor oxidoreductase family protein [Ignavibacteriales bacterium]
MAHEVIMAGFGGQGVLSMGTLLAYAGMLEGKKVSWMPSYGPEMRGGAANCHVIISDEPVASPMVTEPTAVIAMSRPALDKFESWLRPGGLLIINTSMVNVAPGRKDITVVMLPINEMAFELGSDKVANMIALGAFLEVTNAVSVDSVMESLKKALPAHRHSLIPLNRDALAKGKEAASRSLKH